MNSMMNTNASIFNSLNVKGNEFGFGTSNTNNNNNLFYPHNRENDGITMNDDVYGDVNDDDDDEEDEDEANRNPYSLQPM